MAVGRVRELKKWSELELGVYVQVKYPPPDARSKEDAERRPVYKAGVVVGDKRVELSSGAMIDITRMDQLLVEVDAEGKPLRAVR